MSVFAIPLCKSCSFLSHQSIYSPNPALVSLSTARHRQLLLRRPSVAPSFATNFSAHTKQYNYCSADNSEEIELHTELHGEETSSEEGRDDEEEDAENFDSEQLELEAARAVKEFSDSLSRELKIDSVNSLLFFLENFRSLLYNEFFDKIGMKKPLMGCLWLWSFL